MWVEELLPQEPDKGPPLPCGLNIKWPWVHNPGNPLPKGVTKEEAIEIIAATPWAERAARGMARLGGLTIGTPEYETFVSHYRYALARGMVEAM
jgi:hypothetical protein